jgi:hypothetical protein
MRRPFHVVILVSLIAFAPLGAQSVRGIIVDDSTKLPVEGALVELLDAGNGTVARTTRSDSSGNFTVHAGRPGNYKVRAARIGYAPLTSESVRLGVGQLAVMRLRMTTIAQRLVPVRITERRTLKAAELMSSTGFDLRESKGLGMFLSGARLAALGHDNLKEIINSHLQPTIYVRADPVLGDVIRMRQGMRECAPEVFLDGRLLSTAPEPVVEFDSSAALTLMDTIRLAARIDAENQRISASEGYAVSVLSNLRAVDLHGVEVYRANQVLPASLGGWFGITKRSVQTCGTVAVWTKGGLGLPLASARNRRVSGVQVITGTVVSYDSGLPVADVPVTLLTDAQDVIGPTVKSNERGEFTIRTNRAGTLRLHAGSVGYTPATTPSFPLAKDEMVAVKFFVSSIQPVLTPLGIAARLTPQTVAATSPAGFTYRRERGDAGTYYGAHEIARLGAQRLSALLRLHPMVRMAGPAPTDTVTFLRGDDLPRCRPMYLIDGKPVRGDVEATIGALVMERVFGVEVYADPADVPQVFADLAPECGVVAIWMTP